MKPKVAARLTDIWSPVALTVHGSIAAAAIPASSIMGQQRKDKPPRHDAAQMALDRNGDHVGVISGAGSSAPAAMTGLVTPLQSLPSSPVRTPLEHQDRYPNHWHSCAESTT